MVEGIAIEAGEIPIPQGSITELTVLILGGSPPARGALARAWECSGKT